MTAFMFTADATSDVITSIAHGLQTGAGPASLFNIGGALPGGLMATADYYFIRVDADRGKLATSPANAAAGIAVDITATGSGLQQLHIGLPHRRPRTYGRGSLLESADVNGLMDGSIGNLRKPFTRPFWPKIIATGDPPWTSMFFDSNNALIPCIRSAGQSGVLLEVPCEMGDRIIGFDIDVFGTGTAACTLRLVPTSNMSAGNPVTAEDAARPAAWGNVSMPVPPSGINISSRGGVHLWAVSSASGYRIGKMYATVDRPQL